jgi:carboxylate-amine ligase
MVAEGTGADRQLKVFAETGDMKAVVDYMIQQTETGLPETPEKAFAGIG